MPVEPNQHVTQILNAANAGDVAATDQLFPLVYDELRKIARQHMAIESPGLTLQPTALVHEAYLRLLGPAPDAGTSWRNRAHFFAAVGREMRHILVDYARMRNAQKRPDHRLAISLTEAGEVAEESEHDLLALDEALSRLEAVDPRASRVVELRYFTGLQEREAAEALEISLSTLRRDWNFAKAWLRDQLTNP